MRTLWVLPALAIVTLGCAAMPQGDGMDVRTHQMGTDRFADLPQWTETIKTTVAPERWNAAFSPHELHYDKDTLTIRTTRENHEKILKYLGQAAATAG